MTEVRILRIIDTLGMGGAPRGVVEMCRGLDKQKFPQFVCALRADSWFADSLADIGIPVELMGASAFGLPWLAGRICRLAEEFQPDIVHTHLEASKFFGWRASKWSPHCAFVVHENAEPRGHKYPVWMQRPFARRADLILAVSEEVASKVRAVYGVPDHRVHALINGVNIAQIDSERAVDLVQRLGIAPGSVVVGFAGRLTKNKNTRLLLSAWPTVLAKHAEAVLVLMGDGPQRAVLASTARSLGIAHSVKFLGRREDVYGIMKSLDLYVQPTKAEGLSRAVLEAMACRLPVVATAVCGTGEAVVNGTTGLIVPSGDAAALADAMNQYLDDENARQIAGEAGRARAEEKYESFAKARELESIYLRLHGEGHAAPG